MELKDLQKNVLLKDCSSFRIGGNADFFYETKDTNEIIEIARLAKKEKMPFLVIGGCSNILFSDNGFHGIVVRNKSDKIVVDGKRITADSGALFALIIHAAAKNDIRGLEVFLGIPGTIGGAVYGNAGVPEKEIKDFVENVTVYDIEKDKIVTLEKKDIGFGYRHSGFKEKSQIILSVTLKFNGNGQTNKVQLQKSMEKRWQKQPKNWSAGSFFKNPTPDRPAGMLIDQAGMKGFKLGDVKISEKHANFIVNLGKATQKDVIRVAKMAKERVKMKFGIDLEPEVQILDEDGNRVKI